MMVVEDDNSLKGQVRLRFGDSESDEVQFLMIQGLYTNWRFGSRLTASKSFESGEYLPSAQYSKRKGNMNNNNGILMKSTI